MVEKRKGKLSLLLTVTGSILSENVEMCAIWISNEFTDTTYSKYALM